MKFALIMTTIVVINIFFWEVSSYFLLKKVPFNIKNQDIFLLFEKFILYFTGAKVFKSFGLRCLRD